MSKRYEKSEEQYRRSIKVIPLGSQTFSKSRTQYPLGAAPLYAARGKGSRLWDVDGNEYIDFNASLAAVILGYADDSVNEAVQNQLQYGTIYSLPHPLETEVAEAICELVPCAEMVRFGKNGSDATAGAVRLARAVTRREHILVCGYHGWQDWYIGSTMRNLGVPESTRRLTHSFTYNDLPGFHKLLHELKDQVAAVIMEPMNIAEPKENFLHEVADATRKAGALLVFDETITGFRYSLGGAQQLFGVTPDLATFGKAMANGFPISAVAGKGDYMKLMEEIFFSFTFGGETLSLAACKATLSKLKTEPVIATIFARGQRLMKELSAIVEGAGLSAVFQVAGHPTWNFLLIKDHERYSQWQIRTFFLQELFKRGILMSGAHNMNYSHSEEDIDRLLNVYREVFGLVKDSIDSGKLEDRLEAKVLEPLFKVR